MLLHKWAACNDYDAVVMRLLTAVFSRSRKVVFLSTSVSSVGYAITLSKILEATLFKSYEIIETAEKILERVNCGGSEILNIQLQPLILIVASIAPPAKPFLADRSHVLK